MTVIKSLIQIIGGILIVSFFAMTIGLIWGPWVFWLKCMGTDLVLIGLLALVERASKNIFK